MGLPRFTPFPAALVPWLRAVSATSELFHLMLAGVMLQNPMLWCVLWGTVGSDAGLPTEIPACRPVCLPPHMVGLPPRWCPPSLRPSSWLGADPSPPPPPAPSLDPGWLALML